MLRKQLLGLLDGNDGHHAGLMTGISITGSVCNDTRQLSGEEEDEDDEEEEEQFRNDTMAGTIDSSLSQV
jgi:hypothetical protein